MRLAILSSLALLAALAIPGPAAGQRPAGMPPRPKLKAPADTNDWEPYYDLGASLLVKRRAQEADAAFQWAARLDPGRAEPLYGRWVSHWVDHISEWGRYLREDEAVRGAPATIRVDSLRLRAFLRNPFVHQGLVLVAYDMLPGAFSDDLASRAWVAYANADLRRASALMGTLIEKDPARYHSIRFVRASAFVNQGQYDSATVQIGVLLATQRVLERSNRLRTYESQEFLEYALARLMLARRNRAGAKEALQRAVADNLGYAPAHALLAEIALAENDTAAAVRAYAQAVDIDGGDAVTRAGYGTALLAARRPREAAEQLQIATELEPFYAEPYLKLGTALDQAGEPEAAASAYERYLARAPRRDAGSIDWVRKRLAALAQAAGASARPPE